MNRIHGWRAFSGQSGGQDGVRIEVSLVRVSKMTGEEEGLRPLGAAQGLCLDDVLEQGQWPGGRAA